MNFRVGDYVSIRGYGDVVLTIKTLKFNGGNPIAGLSVFGAASNEALIRLVRQSRHHDLSAQPKIPPVGEFVQKLVPANEMLVIALSATKTRIGDG